MNLKWFCALVIVSLLVSCKKDKIEPQPEEGICGGGIVPLPDYSHLENRYLIEVTNNTDYTYTTSTEFDQVMETTVTGDSLKITGIVIPFTITSDTQTVFSYTSTTQFEDVTVSLVFSNNYEHLELNYHSTSLFLGPDQTVSYSGDLTTLALTIDPHPYASEVNDDYEMTVSKKDFWIGLDTTYLDTLTATMVPGPYISIDGESFTSPGHSYYSRYEYDWNTDEVIAKEWYRTPDSLFIQDLRYYGVYTPPHDSVQTMYYGVKL